jgi:[NiFe] hydrogenase assembly HybE family chaperone
LHSIFRIARTLALSELRCAKTQIHGVKRVIPAAQKLESVFNEIARTRMADVPIINSALRVEAVGFREWEGRWIGVLVTPWTMNLVLLPGQNAPLIPLALDEKSVWNFPSGAYEFMGLNDPVIGTCHICPLISPVTEFDSHDEALAVAQEIIITLFAGSVGSNELATRIDDARLKGESISQQNMSRRDFLRMPFMGR